MLGLLDWLTRSRCERAAPRPRQSRIALPNSQDREDWDESEFESGNHRGVTSVFILLLFGSTTPAAQGPRKDSYVRNIQLCNCADRASLDSRIAGCTALINAGQITPVGLAVAHNNRGNAFVAKRDYGRAIQDFDESIRLNPTYAKPVNNRGVAYLKKGEYDLAIIAFDEAIRLNSGYGEAFANRAEVYLKKSDYDRAARDYSEAIRLDPNLEAVWNGRCWTRAILGELQAALEDCNKAIQSQRRNV